YTTSLPTGLTVNNVTVAGNLATITLTGNLIAAGTCADARIQGQILLTVFGYSDISQALITINGQNMKKLFDTSGLVGTTDPYLANQWLP
nr:GerMN domain-containing protein [Anaerolineae bacterium]